MATMTAEEMARAIENRDDFIRRHPNPHPELVRACEQFWEYRERWERAAQAQRQTATEAVRQQELLILNQIADRRRRAEEWFTGRQWIDSLPASEQAFIRSRPGAYAAISSISAQQLQEMEYRAQQRLQLEKAQAEAVRRLQEPARQRARALLLSCLDKQQKKDFETGGWFVVKKADRRYVFQNGGVREQMTNRYLCIVFENQYRDLPVEDLMLSQLLLISSDEQTFVDIARGRERRANPAPRPKPTAWWSRWANRGMSRMKKGWRDG